MLGEPFSSLNVDIRKLRIEREGKATRTKFLKRELHFYLEAITLIPPTVSMKPSSYLKVTVSHYNISPP